MKGQIYRSRACYALQIVLYVYPIRTYVRMCTCSVCVCVRTCTCIHSAIPTLKPFQLTQGPVHSLPLDTTPLDYFHLFRGSDFSQLLSDQTNLYAEQRQRVKPNRRWYPTTPEEMRAFIGINVMMGIDRKPEVHHSSAMQAFRQCSRETVSSPSPATSTSVTPLSCQLEESLATTPCTRSGHW